MALFYNTDGTVSNVEINAIINGKVTSSLATTPTIQQAFEASASNAAAQTANPTRTNRTNTGSLYVKSGATIQKTYSGNSYAVLHPNDPNANKGDVTPIMVDKDYVFVNDLDLVYGKDSAVSVVNDFINNTTASLASAIMSLIPNYEITGSFDTDEEAAICLVPTGSLYYTSAGVLRVKIS